MAGQFDEVSPAQRIAETAASNAAAVAAAEPESTLWSGGYSHRAMIGVWVSCSILSIVALVAGVLLPSQFSLPNKTVWGIVAAFIVGLWGIAIVTYIYRRVSVHYELTTQRLIHQHGILVRTSDRIEMIDINDVASTQGIFERMFNVGGIRISSSDRSHPELLLIGIENVAHVAGLIDDARRKERRKRALHMA